MDDVKFSSLKGKTLVSIEGKVDDDAMVFTTSDGDIFRLYHMQDCCESVSIYDIAGDLSDLMGSPLTLAGERTSDKLPRGVKLDYPDDSMTWTFYRLGTVKGTVVVRWYGSSNGYYSESVYFERVN